MTDEFKAITTQEELNEVIGARLKRAEDQYQEKITNLEKENGTLKEQLDNANNLLEESKEGSTTNAEELEDLRNKVSAYELNNIKAQIALQYGIPYELAERLQGKDKEEISEDAKRLKDFVGKRDPIAPLKNVNSEGDSYSNFEKDLLNISKNITQGE